MKGANSYKFPRHFLAALILTNTGNVEPIARSSVGTFHEQFSQTSAGLSSYALK